MSHNMKDDNHTLTTSDSVKLAGTIDNLELTGLQLALLCNALAGVIQHPEILPKHLREDEKYISSNKILYDLTSTHLEQIVGRKFD